jgi:peptidoglycan/xylan/chitin deacetylase (PgdA/CDA1 family)
MTPGMTEPTTEGRLPIRGRARPPRPAGCPVVVAACLLALAAGACGTSDPDLIPPPTPDVGPVADADPKADADPTADAGPEPDAGFAGGGLAMAFDDDFVAQWYAQREVFRRYGAKVTFFVTRPDQLTEAEVDMLRALRDDGHEIAHHGLRHLNMKAELGAGMSRDDYVKDEVLAGVTELERLGFESSAFAHPWGAHDDDMVQRLSSVFAVQRSSGRLSYGERVFLRDAPEPVQLAASFDEANAEDAEIEVALERAHDEQWTLRAYAHRIMAEDTARSHITPARLERLLQRAQQLGLRFVTYGELAPPLPEASDSREVMYRFLDQGSRSWADAMLDDEWNVASRFEPAKLPWPLTWTEDPFNENYWRFLFYSLRPTRHLLHAYLETGDVRYRDKLLGVLESFVERGTSADQLSDPHTSAFLVMVLVNTYVKLEQRGDLPKALAQRIRSVLVDRGKFLLDDDNYEGHDNHGVTEAAALLLLAHNFPALEGASEWKDVAVGRLAALLRENVATDGVQIEQSPFYHFYVLNFFWQIHAWNRQQAAWATDELSTAIARMTEFAAYVTYPNGEVPLIGASKQLNMRTSYRDIHTEIADIDPQFAFVWTGGERGEYSLAPNKLYAPSGWSFLRSPLSDARPYPLQTMAIFDVGPYRTAHSHLDALQLVLFAAGRKLVVDSGLFSYENGPEKDYFRSTRAHNTVVIDGKDQRQGSATPLKTWSGDGYECQSGASDLSPGASHSRAVCLIRDELVVVLDRLQATDGSSHRYEQLWHLAPDLSATVRGDVATAVDADGQARLSITQGASADLTMSVVRGVDAPLQGWYSEPYEHREPNSVVIASKQATQARYATVLAVGAWTNAAVQVTATADGWTISADGPERIEIRWQAPFDPGEAVSVETR